MKNVNWKWVVKALIIMFTAIFLAQWAFKSMYREKENIVKEQIFNSKDSMDVEKVEIINLGELKSTDLYTKNCKFCHGSQGKGDGIKARTNNEICPYDLSKETKGDKIVYYVILNGQHRMPSHESKLNDTSIKVLVIYIKKFRK